MDAVWVALGILVLVLTLLDVFLTALNYDEAGFVAGRLARWQWSLTRMFTRRIARRWRPVVLRQVTGLQLIVTVAVWVGGTILGYGLIYFGSMEGKNFLFSGQHPDLFAAVYFSAAQLATVGTSQLTPNTDLLSALSILETLTGVLLLSLVLTFLFGVYDVVSSLRSLSTQFYSPVRAVGTPVTSLKPYFPDGQENGLDSHLQGIFDSFGAYTDGLRLHHAAYYFQSGRDTFSLPFSLQMLVGTIGALRWGLPASHPSTKQPALLLLTEQFEGFQGYMHPLLRWTNSDVPETVSRADFTQQIEALGREAGQRPPRGRVRRSDSGDPWVREFAVITIDMAELVGALPFEDMREAYDRYLEWLPFAYKADRFTSAVARDLDYQPVYSDPSEAAPTAVLAPAPEEKPPSQRWGIAEFIRSRATLIDPGYSRLISALRALMSAALAVAILAVGLPAFGLEPMPAAVFGGVIAMFTGGASGGGAHGIKRLASLITVIPIVLALALNGLFASDPVVSTIVVAVLAFVGVGAALLGPRFAALGQLLFISYYFTLLLHLQASELVPFSIAALTGVLSSVLIQMIPNRGAHARLVRGGVAAFERRLVRSLDPLIDTVSAARWDPDLVRRTRNEMKQTHHTAAFLAGQLTGDDPDIGLTHEQANALRIRLHDAELGLVNLGEAARHATGAGIPITVRAHLAGVLQTLQKHIRSYPDRPAWVRISTDLGSSPKEDRKTAEAEAVQAIAQALPPRETVERWPQPARRVVAAALELQRASDALYWARVDDLVYNPANDEGEELSDDGSQITETTNPATTSGAADAPGAHSVTQSGARGTVAAGPAQADTAPIWRRAIQAGLSTGIALFLGSFVSSTHQFWAAMPAYQAIGGSDGETFVKGTQKIVGTIAGATVGFGIAILAGPNPAILLPVLAVCVFGTVFFRSASSPLTTFWQTMMFAQLYEFMGRLSTEAIGVRILETVIGAVVALVIAALVLPTRTRTKYATQAEKLAQTIESITTETLDMWKHATSLTAEDVDRLSKIEIRMTEQLRDLQVTATPLRHGLGKFDPGSIDTQLTGFWELLYYTRQFVASAEQGRTAKAKLTVEQWEKLEKATRDNFAALLSVFRGQSVGPADADIGLDDLGDDAEPREAEAALRALARANQTVALMVNDASPQAAEVWWRRAQK
ncbi:FUSC family protein [Salinibacterium hongtaonis]|uniref:FUSC family protein n=1 Tax=Homoserinimonas hongtaonis TaxID=2079791 RepID=UPI000D3C3217|nr:FUSC family protein [Salinibacterium hongtaonis]AWB88959.1 hypothetical protein C2138_04865 [Salinibacterium hongtaonis]